MKYNYVIFGSANDYYKYAYADVHKLENVKYKDKRIDTENGFLLNLYRFHNSSKTNLIPLPFKGIWEKYAYKDTFDDDKPICFIFFGGNEWCKKDYFAYLRKKYPYCKIVIYCQDIIDKSKNKNLKDSLSFCDLKLSYDKGDAQKYGMILYQDVYSKVEIDTEGVNEEYDVCLIIKAKDRLKKAIDLYDKLESFGLKCYFYLTDVEKEDRIERKNVYYGKKLPYTENLKIVMKSKVIAEILQSGSKGYTFRAGEAIVYGKKLLTDNKSVKEEPFYSPDKIFVFDNPEDIKKEFFDGKSVDYNYTEQISPKKLLEFIDEKL